jgi:hypothetical protein
MFLAASCPFLPVSWMRDGLDGAERERGTSASAYTRTFQESLSCTKDLFYRQWKDDDDTGKEKRELGD